MTITITKERPDSLDAAALILELESHLSPMYPDESRHGYSVEKLMDQDVAFFVIRHDGMAAGCGGVQLYFDEYGGEYGELKRMYVRPRSRGLGLAKRLMLHLADHAQTHGVPLLRLETGIHQPEAIGLYEHWGFEQIPPFGDYREDLLSLFYEKCIC